MEPFDLTSPPKIKLSEKDVVKQCLDYVRARGYYPVRLQVGRFILPDKEVVEGLTRLGIPFRWDTVGEKGLPDYVCVKRDFFLEVKAPGKKPSTDQIKKAFELEAAHRIQVATIDKFERLPPWLDAFENP